MPSEQTVSAGQQANDRVVMAVSHIVENMLPHGVDRPRVALMLGTGFEFFAHHLQRSESLDYGQIPGFPQLPEGGQHRGRLWRGHVAGTRVFGLQGRVHTFDGYTPDQLALPIRALARLGVNYLITTGAVGAVQRGYRQGELIFVRDHIALFAENWLSGPHHESFGSRNPSSWAIYPERLRTLAGKHHEKILHRLNHDGVVALTRGPQYESPAELRALETLGADIVTFSMVPEVLVAAQSGLQVLGIACVTTTPPSVFEKPQTKAMIEAAAAEQQEKIAKLLTAILSDWPKK